MTNYPRATISTPAVPTIPSAPTTSTIIHPATPDGKGYGPAK
jgi:hypothetical protein